MQEVAKARQKRSEALLVCNIDMGKRTDANCYSLIAQKIQFAGCWMSSRNLLNYKKQLLMKENFNVSQRLLLYKKRETFTAEPRKKVWWPLSRGQLYCSKFYYQQLCRNYSFSQMNKS